MKYPYLPRGHAIANAFDLQKRGFVQLLAKAPLSTQTALLNKKANPRTTGIASHHNWHTKTAILNKSRHVKVISIPRSSQFCDAANIVACRAMIADTTRTV